MDSLGLEKKVGLDAHDFFSDSLLVNFNSLYFDAYLVQSLDFYAYKSFVFNEDAHVNTINAVNSIDGAKMYSRPIRNLLLYNFLYGHIKSEGATFYSDSITNALFAQKKLSLERYKNVNDLKQLHAHLLPGKPAPHLQGITTEGKVVTLKDFIGKVVFVDIWATWCGPCIKALPRVMELQEKLKNNKEVVFIFLSKDCHEEEPWINYLKAHPNFKGIHLRERAKEDFPYELNWEIIGIPHYLLIDKQGNIIDAFAHNNSYEKLAEMIEEASRK
jgi:thiol-disulfide isomerase/thioredoxin